MQLVEFEERLRGAGLARAGEDHHHLVCRSCGLTVDIADVSGTAPCVDAPNAAGFVVDEAAVTFWGLCPDCR